MSDPITFLAALAGSNTAAKWLAVSSDGDCKLTLEASASELGQVLRLATAGGKRLRILVEVDE